MRWPSEDLPKRVSDIWARQRASVYVFIFFSFVTLTLQSMKLDSPLLGSHSWRQADTLFTAYSYCYEGSEFLKPKIAQRENTDGVAIGEFPLYSWVVSLPCQASGQWSEAFPKVLSWFLFWFGSLLFSLTLVRKWGRKESFFDFATLLLCAELTLTYFTRALPDVMAFFLIASAGAIWTGQRYPKVFSTRYLTGLALAVCAFLIRPYLVLLIFFVLPFGVFRWLLCGLAIQYAYNWWFLDHAKQSTIDYYLMRPKPFLEAWSELPGSVLPFMRHTFKDHLNYILLPFFLLGFFRRFLTAGFWWAATLLVLFVSGRHFTTHPYYMLAPAILALSMAWSMIPTSNVARYSIIFIFSFIGIANSQHHFHGHRNNVWKDMKELASSRTEPQEPIVTLTSLGNQVPTFLYYAKRTGWSYLDTPENRDRVCMLPAKLKVVIVDDTVQELDCSKK